MAVSVEGAAPTRPWTVRAIIPGFNRRRDVGLLLADLAGLRLTGRLSVILVDNASEQPLADLAAPEGLEVRHLRLESNTGGSGGFNAGMACALAEGRPGDPDEAFWLLDSDARVFPDTLLHLLTALDEDPGLAAVGSALVEPGTGTVFVAGGFIDRRTGEYVQPLPPG